MAKFHVYELTITASIAVPANVTGDANTFVTTAIPAAAKTMLEQALASVKPGISLPVVALGTAVEVPPVV